MSGEHAMTARLGSAKPPLAPTAAFIFHWSRHKHRHRIFATVLITLDNPV